MLIALSERGLTMNSEENVEESDSDNEFRHSFNTSIQQLINSKRGDNCFFLSREQYLNMIETVKHSKVKRHKKPLDYRRLHRFDVIEKHGKEVLIKPITDANPGLRYFTTNEELFDILHEVHHAVSHGGRNKMAAMIKTTYANITKEVIMTYLTLCQLCRWRERSKKSVTVAKLDIEELQRGSIDILDMSHLSKASQYVLAYRDEKTKFVFLRPLRTKEPSEVASFLLDIFAIVGCAMILQSNLGRAFVKDVIKEICSAWKDLKIVHGEHKRDETTADDIEQIKDAINKWMSDTSNGEWVQGLRHVQVDLNSKLHSSISKSPFEAMYRSKPSFGLRALSDFKDGIEDLDAEEDLVDLLRSSTSCSVCFKNCKEPFHLCIDCSCVHHPACGTSSTGPIKSGFVCAKCIRPSCDRATKLNKRAPSMEIMDSLAAKKKKLLEGAVQDSMNSKAQEFLLPVGESMKCQGDFEELVVKVEVFDDEDE